MLFSLLIGLGLLWLLSQVPGTHGGQHPVVQEPAGTLAFARPVGAPQVRQMTGAARPVAAVASGRTAAEERLKKGIAGQEGLLRAIAGRWAPAPEDCSAWMTGLRVAEDGTFECRSGQIQDGLVRVLSVEGREINLKRTIPDANDHVFSIDGDFRRMVGFCPQSGCTYTLTRVDDDHAPSAAQGQRSEQIPASRVWDVQWSGRPSSSTESMWHFALPFDPDEMRRVETVEPTDYFTLTRKADDDYKLEHFSRDGTLKTSFPDGKVKANSEAVFYMIRDWFGTVITKQAHLPGDSAEFSDLVIDPPGSLVQEALAPSRLVEAPVASAPAASASADEVPMVFKCEPVSARELLQAVRESPQPLLVDAYAQWCGPCQIMKPVMDEVAKSLAGRVRVLKFDTEADELAEALASQWAIQALPTLLFFKAGGGMEPAYRFEGAAPSSHVQALAERHFFGGPGDPDLS